MIRGPGKRIKITNESDKKYTLCYACGMPLNKEDRMKPGYIRGVQCHHCETTFDEQDRARFAERQKQFDQDSSRMM